ncbi:MAG: type I 3-dehydroquinate dehydratase, partial [Erysipelotrichia bacterium]|nr:type I 3-dehydroquinate dehydratase [Erysipelotrichia bacterium]
MKKENIKICMSVIAKTDDEIKASMQQAKDADVNMVEWRVDYYEHAQDIEKVINMLKCIRSIIEDKELIFT